jgi:hypothetical protein
METVIYSIFNRQLQKCIRVIFPGNRILYSDITTDAARWCYPCSQTAYNHLPEHIKAKSMVVVNHPVNDGYEPVCQGCEQEAEV